MPDIGTDKVCFLIIKARQFESDMPGGNGGNDGADEVESPLDDVDAELVEEVLEDPTYSEIEAFIDGLNEDEQIELVALMWVGRGDYLAQEWDDAIDEARRARDEHGHTAAYLLGATLLPDYLEEGLAAFGLDCEDVETTHL